MKQLTSILLTLSLLIYIAGCQQSEGREPLPPEPTYILNKNSLVYHNLDCKYLPAEKNQVEIEYADIDHNPEYRPCGHCNP